MATVPPPKRRRTGRKLAPMVEGGDSSLDAAIYIRSKEGERVLVPVRSHVSAQPTAEPGPEPEPEPDLYFTHDAQQSADIDMDSGSHNTQRKNRCFYMKQFVERVGVILQAMQAREALPDLTICTDCSQSVAHWRCDDCIGGKLLCRSCMRHSHFSNPFHRIECWTGTHFRKAALWEVGVYLTLPHQNGPSICQNLAWQQQMLEKFQKKKDEVVAQHTPVAANKMHANQADSEPDPEREAAHDQATLQFLDQLLAGHSPDEVLEDDDDELVDTEADLQDMDAGTAGFTNYMNERSSADPLLPSQQSIPIAPNCDALSNQYIRVVHTNGIHHIALVTCTCQGHKNITTDLIYAGWVLTSFVQV